MDSRVRYHARGGGYSFFFTEEEVVFASLHGDQRSKRYALALRFIGASPDVQVEGRSEQKGKVSYFIGNDPEKWQRGLSTFREVVYRDLWPGIDAAFRGEKGELKYEFLVHPGARIDAIRLAYRGADGLSVDEKGHLNIETPLGTLVDKRPLSHQDIDGKRAPVRSRFLLQATQGGETICGFQVGALADPTLPLVIDPGLVYSTYLGGSDNDCGLDTAVDAAGNVYVSGYTASPDFPVTAGVYDPSYNGGQPQGSENDEDSFITKLDATGGTLVYSTYLGGSASRDRAEEIEVDAAGCAYVAGNTLSSDFPTTPGAYQASIKGHQDVFVAKLDPTGTQLVYSTYLGGSSLDSCYDFVLDEGGHAYPFGYTVSADFPTTPGAFDSTLNGGDGWIAKLDPDGAELVFSTFIGGSGDDAVWGAAVDGQGNVHIAGQTYSQDFPTTPGTFDTTRNGPRDGFVLKLNPTGTELIQSTLLGGSSEDLVSSRLALDAAGSPCVAVLTRSSDFPTTEGAFDRTYNGAWDEAIVKLMPDLSGLVFSTFFGGSGDDSVIIAVGAREDIYLVGTTSSTNLPTTSDALSQTHNGGTWDGFLAKMDAAGANLLYGTYVGGARQEGIVGYAVDALDNVYLTGQTNSVDFPITLGALQDSLCGPYDGFVMKFDLSPDSDQDGLSDNEEREIGTDPDHPDSDDDGLLDGTEVDVANGCGCPNPLDADSDDDTLLDGHEVAMDTNPCNADTDGDGLRDDIDPDPNTHPESDNALAQAMRALADFVSGLDLSRFIAPNDNARAGRRNALANRVRNAANATEEENYGEAIDHLESALDRVDGEEPPKDWMVACDERNFLVTATESLVAFLEQRLTP